MLGFLGALQKILLLCQKKAHRERVASYKAPKNQSFSNGFSVSGGERSGEETIVLLHEVLGIDINSEAKPG